LCSNPRTTVMKSGNGAATDRLLGLSARNGITRKTLPTG
jgi:hypothetical protein